MVYTPLPSLSLWPYFQLLPCPHSCSSHSVSHEPEACLAHLSLHYSSPSNILFNFLYRESLLLRYNLKSAKAFLSIVPLIFPSTQNSKFAHNQCSINISFMNNECNSPKFSMEEYKAFLYTYMVHGHNCTAPVLFLIEAYFMFQGEPAG